MTDEDVSDRLDRLESLIDQHKAEIDRQKETIERQREQIAELERQQSGDTSQERPIADGTSVKVLGELDASDGTGVRGHNTTASGTAFGVEGLTDSVDDGAAGVRGVGTATSGGVYGTLGRVDSPSGVGVVGAAADSAPLPEFQGFPTGVWGTTEKSGKDSDVQFGTGVYGGATASSGEAYGVVGATDSPDGYGLYTLDDAQIGGTTELTTLAGSLTGGTDVTDLVGPGLAIDGGRVLLASRAPNSTAPTDRASTLEEMVGDGTSGNPYVIENDWQLQAMSADLSADYVLGNDVDASLTGQWNDGDGFEPVGDRSTPFSGSLNGRGHTISGLTIDRGSDYIGLFGAVGSGGTVENVRLANINVTASNAVGGIVGSHGGTLQRVGVGGGVTGTGQFIAGALVGYNDGGTVRQSFATASVDGDERVGGVLGRNDSGTVELSFAAGQVSGNSEVGGIVGRNVDTVQDAYYDSQATNQSDAIGTNNGSTNDLTSLTTSEMQGSSAESNMSLLDFATVWTTRPSDYPTLQVLVD